MINLLVILALFVVAVIVTKILLSVSKTGIQILLHILVGWITLTIVNILPGINIPTNIITLLISGFGGVFGTLILVIYYALL